MDRKVSPGSSPHRIVSAPELAQPVGFSHAVVAARGRTVYLGGQTALAADGTIVGRTVAEQYDQAAGNVVAALRAAGARPEHLVQLTYYVTDVAAYKAALPELGVLHRKHFGRHYPAIALFGVTALFDEDALLELLGVAVIPDFPDAES